MPAETDVNLFSAATDAENPYTREVFLPLLRKWIELSKEHEVDYSIYWGTLLGQVRNQRIIPYDQDIDVVVGKAGLKTLYALPGRVPECIFNDELKDQPIWKDHEIRLVIRKDVISYDGPRYNHLGESVATQVDACSFNGPLARLIIKLPIGLYDREYWHLDVDLFTDLARFNAYPTMHEVDELPMVETRLLEGLHVSRLIDPSPYLVVFYGHDFMVPDHIYRNGQWVSRAALDRDTDDAETTMPPQPRRFTIGIMTDDDLDGVHFTLHTLRMYHPEIIDRTEILVINNTPDGPDAGLLRSLENSVPGYRYIANADVKGAAVRNLLFSEARGAFVICIDCGISIVPGALKCLYDYCDAHPDSNDLLQGPLLHDDMTTTATHLSAEWQAGMYGRFAVGNREDVGTRSEPLEIQMQSVELFACRCAVWPGLNPVFQGFGGEAGYIHEKVRRRGGRTLCLPFLRWLRRSSRALENSNLENWEARIWNYIVGRRELDLGTQDIREHFAEFLGEQAAGDIFERVESKLPSAYRLDVNPLGGELRVHIGSGDLFGPIWDQASLHQQRQLLRRLSDVAQSLSIRLFLYWGSLLGHIREGGIIPWDDDVDLALFDSTDLPRFNDALKAEGLQVWDMNSHIKICDGSYQRTSRLPYTWPAVDIFNYSLDPEDIQKQAQASNQPPHYVLPQRHVILPGRPVEFEGVKLWEPDQPLAILDKHYDGWRHFEETTAWSHIKEGPFREWSRRPIVTDSAGHKIAVAHGPPALAGHPR